MSTPHSRRTVIEPFKIKVVERIPMRTRAEREAVLVEAGYNLFAVPADHVTFDFLTDSGTAALSTAQWSAMMQADESYAGSRSFLRLKETVGRVTGYANVIPAHQGRACERVLFGHLVKPGSKIPSNTHFDTTRANILAFGGEAVDLPIPEARDFTNPHPFKGNIDLARLEKFCDDHRTDIPFAILTLTNNSGGGQPVSLENIRKASLILKQRGIPLLYDACRYAENCAFIRLREPGQAGRPIREIARETFELADGAYMSGKKDALVNMGGFIALKDDHWMEALRAILIRGDGFPTYGGMSARDLEAMAVGLEEALEEDYLEYRLATVRYMAEGLNRLGVQTIQPPGGSALFIDAQALLPHLGARELPAQTLVIELFREEGIRSAEIGSGMLGRTINGTFTGPGQELVRWAFPRRAYTQSHFDYVLEGMAELMLRKDTLRGMRLEREVAMPRQFTGRFLPL